jgi:hypothetical protein
MPTTMHIIAEVDFDMFVIMHGAGDRRVYSNCRYAPDESSHGNVGYLLKIMFESLIRLQDLTLG